MGKVEQMANCSLHGIPMTTRALIWQLGLATALASAGVAAAQQAVPVTFAHGQNSATVTGSITGDQDRNYTVDARAGQTLTVSLKATRGSAEMNVWAPGGDSAMSLGSADPSRFSAVLPANGRYRVQVYQMRAFARRGATASYALTIAITGRSGAAAGRMPATRPGDAKVAGTNYNATADVDCALAAGAPMGRCPAGVMRFASGEATVEIRLPSGQMRHIFFKAGRPTGHDVYKAAFSARRQGDLNIIRVGAETYRIVDAFVVGG
ncbi:MAG: hypothetical protein B7Y82_03740 [Sphingomonadales bacterium 32-65-25]|nr:MAG: hypothetical protein B7Y82_03740 [Sphingomonadales bacterium 32-65-25]